LTLSAAAALCSFALHASAETIEDVCDALREIGAGDSFIQSVRNSYDQEPHDENGMTINGRYDTYANWVEYVYIYEDDINDYIMSHVFTTQTTAATETPGSVTQTTAVTTAVTAVVTEVPFSKMSLDEQKVYVASLSDEEREQFLASLSADDRRSILKQLGLDDKTAVLAILTDMGNDLGVHVSIDGISGDTVSYSVRDDSGNLLDAAVLGYQIDSTGWDLTLPLLLSCGAVLIAVCGFTLTALRGGLTTRTEDERRSV